MKIRIPFPMIFAGALATTMFVANPAGAAPGKAADSVASLEYATADFATSRKVLLKLVARHDGELMTLKGKAGEDLQLQFLIPTERLPEFLSELGQVGHGIDEELTTVLKGSVPAGFSQVNFTLKERAAPASAATTGPAPDFTEAFLGLGMFLARLAYVMIWMAPLWLLFGVLIWKRQALGRTFSAWYAFIAGLFARRNAPTTPGGFSGAGDGRPSSTSGD